MINVALAFDDNYFYHAMSVVLQSVAVTNGSMSFYLLYDGNDFDGINKKILKLQKKLYCFEYELLDLSKCIEEDFVVKKPFLSRSTFNRLYLTEVLPYHVDKIVYLDSDVLVMKDLSAFDIDMTGYDIAAVEDCTYTFLNHEFSFNAGVCLMNIKSMRKKDAFTQFKKIAASYDLTDEDQSILNIWTNAQASYDNGMKWQGAFKRLPVKFNDQKMSVYTEAKPLASDTVIKHFVYKCKPWKRDGYTILDPTLLDEYMSFERLAKILTN